LYNKRNSQCGHNNLHTHTKFEHAASHKDHHCNWVSAVAVAAIHMAVLELTTAPPPLNLSVHQIGFNQ